MENQEATYRSLMSVENLAGLDTQTALKHIASLVDLSFDLRETQGLKGAIALSDQLKKRHLTATQSAWLHYYTANAWGNLRRLTRPAPEQAWEWEQPEMEKEIIHLRLALRSEAFQRLPKEARCAILTNLGNALNHVGRFVEALEHWDRALDTVPSFPMAQGNRGYALTFYARALYDDGHKLLLRRQARADLRAALSAPLNDDAKKGFEECLAQVDSVLPPPALQNQVDMHGFPLGDSEEEVRYRKWCLDSRLFLNPLNDLGAYSVAASDVLTCPSVVVAKGAGPHYHGFFNQIKQEFVSARYLYYEGTTATKPHFSDRDVRLYNTLDYPCYSLAVERVKMAFRVAYSIMDKVAFFLNDYLHLCLPEKSVYLRTLWYNGDKKTRRLKPQFHARQNWPLRGLFWLCKDLYYRTDSDFEQSMEPDAEALAKIRNHLEHKYLKLHDDLWPGAAEGPAGAPMWFDAMALHLYRREFEGKALRLLKIVRAALVYLSLGVHWEERAREEKRPADALVPKIRMDVWEDNWKV